MAWGRVSADGFLACKSVLWWQWRMGTCTHTDVRSKGDSWEHEFNGTGTWRGHWHFGLKSAAMIHEVARFLAGWANTWFDLQELNPPVSLWRQVVSVVKLRVKLMLPFRRRQLPAMVQSKVWGDVALRVSTPHLQESQPVVFCVSGVHSRDFGAVTAVTPLHQAPERSWKSWIMENLTAAWYETYAVLPCLIKAIFPFFSLFSLFLRQELLIFNFLLSLMVHVFHRYWWHV